MHEYSLVQALLERVTSEARQRGAARVTALRVSIGDLAGVEAELFRSAFELARSGTLCAQARLDLVAVAAQWRCPSCGASVAPGKALVCADCLAPARLVGGNELILERIEMEVDDDV